jgi:hypothetical protein
LQETGILLTAAATQPDEVNPLGANSLGGGQKGPVINGQDIPVGARGRVGFMQGQPF